MDRSTINVSVLLALGLGITLALLWLPTNPLPARADPGILYVATDGDDANDCSTVGSRCRTVQRAVSLAAADDEVWVAGGVYTDADTASLGYVVALTKTVALRGGWDASFTTQDFVNTPTTLSAEGVGRVIYINGSISPTIEGFVITRGDATGWGGKGGGLYSEGASLVVCQSVISGSVANRTVIGFGGGLYLEDSAVTMIGTQVISNTASNISYGWGGGLFLDGSTATLTGTQVMSNTASTGYDGYGGGLALGSSAVNLEGATSVWGNVASTAGYGYGGGLHLGDVSTATLVGTQVAGNTATTAANSDGYGGGLYLSSSTVDLSGATIVRDNTASTAHSGYGGGLALLSSSTAILSDTQVMSNTASTADSDGGYGGGLYLDNSTTVLTDTQVVNNTASTGHDSYGYGGGLYLYYYSTTILNNSQVISNTASTAYKGYGGGFALLSSSTATLSDTHVVSNTGSTAGSGYGGGLHLAGSTAILNNSRVMSNTASTAGNGHGGGLHLDCSTATLSNSRVISNTASTESSGCGGGLYLRNDSTATLNNTWVMRNTASTASSGYGGGLHLDFYYSTATLNSSWVMSNTASTAGSGYGGGLLLSINSTATLNDTRLMHNTASTVGTGYGGGLQIDAYCTVNLSGTTVQDNTASTAGTGYGGGLYAAANAVSTTAVNSVITHNTREGLYIDGGSHTFVNCTLSDNNLTGARVNDGTLILTNDVVARHDVGINQTAGTVVADYTLFYNTVNIVGSVTNDNPVYGDPRFADAAGGDYHLQADSTAIDRGDPAGTTATGGPAPITDFDGQGRPVGARVDIGADEFPVGLTVTKQADPDPVQSGSQLTYTIRVTNTGYVTLTATLTDALPDHVTPSGVLTWTPTITAPSGVWTETVVVTVEMGYIGPLVNSVQVTTDEGAMGMYTRTATVVPTVSFSSVAHNVNEGGRPAIITVTLSASSDLTVTVDYAASAGTATADDDYTAASGTLIFGPGTTVLTFTVPITDDGMYENDETVLLTLSDPVSATLGISSATLTIADDDSPPTAAFSSAGYSAGEGAGPALITVTLSGATALTATVDYAASDGTATAGEDYTAASGTLTFAPGTTVLTFTVPITDDGICENDETVLLTLSGPVSATLGAFNATLIIFDDDSPTVAFSSATYNVGEGAGPAVVTVTLSGDTALTATVEYATDDGTAVVGSDYVATSGTLTFAPGTTVLTFTVPITDDGICENDETVLLTLSDPVSATLGVSSATLTIADDDSPPTVAFSSAAYGVDEGVGAAVVTVTLTGSTALTATVDYTTSGGTATAGDDFAAISGTLIFTPATTSQVFTIPILDDALDESDETFTLTLSNPTAAIIGDVDSAVLTIMDDDGQPSVRFSAAAYAVAEAAGSAKITVTLSNPYSLTVTVDYAALDGTASAEDDYLAASGRLTFAPGATSRTFTVSILDDALAELDETVTLTLSNPDNAKLGAPDSATLTILNDDGQSYTICLPLVMRNASSSSSLSAFADASRLRPTSMRHLERHEESLDRREARFLISLGATQ